MQRAGLDPRPYSAHSLRAGLATSAAEAGVSERAIMAQTGHRSLTVAPRIHPLRSLFRDNAAAQVGAVGGPGPSLALLTTYVSRPGQQLNYARAPRVKTKI